MRSRGDENEMQASGKQVKHVMYVKMVECCFTSTATVGLLGTGAKDGHLDFHTAPELWWAGVT